MTHLALDTETNGLLDTCTKWYTLQWAYRGGANEVVSGVIHLHHELGTEYELNQEVIELLKQYPYFHNASFDIPMLRRFGYECDNYHDTQVMGYCLNANVEPIGGEIHSLRAWGERLKALGIVEQGKLDYQGGFDEWSPEMDVYGEQDAILTMYLAEYLSHELGNDILAWEHYHNIELPYIEVIIALEASGLPLNYSKCVDAVPKMSALLEQKLADIRKLVPLAPQGNTKKVLKPYASEAVYQGDSLECFDNFSLQPEEGQYLYLGEFPDDKDPERVRHHYKQWLPFKPSSGDQVAWALKAYYGWEPTKFTDAGSPSTDGDVLEELDYDLAQAICQYKEVEKVFNTFLGAFLRAADSDGYIRTGWNQTLTLTGRLSTSGNMNLN